MPTTEITAGQLTDGVINIIDLLVATGLTASKSEARRLIQQGGVFINEAKVASIDHKINSEQLKEGVKIRKGKKIYHKAYME
jgi:tyrosyl-tRNA synthetase